MNDRTEDVVFAEWRSAPTEALEAELRELLTKHAYAVCWNKLNRHAPEVVNRAVYIGLAKAGDFEGKSKFSTWFQAIVQNECTRALQAKLRLAREKGLEDLSEAEHAELSSEVNIDAKMYLEKLTEGLSTEEKQLMAGVSEGMSFRELAAQTGTSEAGARKRWERLRRKVRRLAGWHEGVDDSEGDIREVQSAT